MNKKRLDALLVEKGFADNIKQATGIIMSGKILINNKPADKAGEAFAADSTIKIKGKQIPYVSRGGIKLAEAINKFNLNVKNFNCIDIGASTGGFTDCLLQNGAKHIFAVDVGYGQLAWKLRNDARVTVLERTNIKHLDEKSLPYLLDLAVIDVSFISLKQVIPQTLNFLKKNAKIIALIKPQFEAPRDKVEKGGVIKKRTIHNLVIQNLKKFFTNIGLNCILVIASPILGPKGNKEFFIYLKKTEKKILNR
ncbi:MAG: TlyA family RNA methyltransferase [Deltaproteobacteria bacterium]|nr:TlyA family RNA methyltransferase [Deltaproteobacteria bacterium]